MDNILLLPEKKRTLDRQGEGRKKENKKERRKTNEGYVAS
jgi:hypothetical protein